LMIRDRRFFIPQSIVETQLQAWSNEILWFLLAVTTFLYLLGPEVPDALVVSVRGRLNS
jgi:hypothetical protein